MALGLEDRLAVARRALGRSVVAINPPCVGAGSPKSRGPVRWWSPELPGP